jgi:DNA-binding transcriptional ArsR family regulator
MTREPRDPGGVRVVASPTVEFVFAIFVFLNDEAVDGRAPWRGRVLDRAPGIRDRMITFALEYGSSGGAACDDWGDVVLLLARAGMLTNATPDEFFDWLESPAADFSPAPWLESETDAANATIAARIERLRLEPELRARYVALLREFWSTLQPEWEAAGFARATAMRSEDWRRAIKGSLAQKQEFSQAIGQAIREGHLLIVPLALAPEGQMIYTLPGVLLVSFGPDTEKKAARQRENAARAAQVFKVFSDPTRNAILGALLRMEYSVTDLAGMFDLAQPTVSAHVKILREASLLEAAKSGNQTVYRARNETVRRVLQGGMAQLTDVAVTEVT